MVIIDHDMYCNNCKKITSHIVTMMTMRTLDGTTTECVECGLYTARLDSIPDYKKILKSSDVPDEWKAVDDMLPGIVGEIGSLKIIHSE